MAKAEDRRLHIPLDFDEALKALLATPPPPKAEKTAPAKKAKSAPRKRKAAKRR